jgi:predicted nucleic acid-binding Zn ribbon protein
MSRSEPINYCLHCGELLGVDEAFVHEKCAKEYEASCLGRVGPDELNDEK